MAFCFTSLARSVSSIVVEPTLCCTLHLLFIVTMASPRDEYRWIIYVLTSCCKFHRQHFKSVLDTPTVCLKQLQQAEQQLHNQHNLTLWQETICTKVEEINVAPLPWSDKLVWLLFLEYIRANKFTHFYIFFTFQNLTARQSMHTSINWGEL